MRFILSLFGVIAIACANPEIKPMSQTDWQGNMREISISFSTLLKFALSGDAFFDPKNASTIENETKRMAALTNQIHQNGKNLQFDKDPALKYVTRDFNKDMSLANSEVKAGRMEFARHLIKGTSNYCISCHTRNDQGQQNNIAFLFADANSLDSIEKADYFAAVRQFPKALETYDRVLTNAEFAEGHQQQWANGIKKSLAIAIRVNRNPSLALEIVSRVFDAHTVPLSLREAALTWRVSIKEWRDSDKGASIKDARILITKAQDSIRKTWINDAGLVYYLRASSILHDVLRQQKGKLDYSEALYLSGLAAEGLKEINLWTFDEIYYESCIRYKPHSVNSKKCFSRLEALRLFSTPEDKSVELKELRDLAI